MVKGFSQLLDAQVLMNCAVAPCSLQDPLEGCAGLKQAAHGLHVLGGSRAVLNNKAQNSECLHGHQPVVVWRVG